ncbi:HTTM domain-containing protein [Nonlabens marinus]|uniref:Vitamin K-dependent gamma-carboxylase n=1 Tax=Nonlabens marinus S1-08 TaxID=1454201 RepID=W8VVS1_9FLAO|nr:HTTM domain-containing protein [Nonlabens marinus]BAO55683.1 vitamin K-dependent gamma-carboxylase [Nonlabens marinus S1-08]
MISLNNYLNKTVSSAPLAVFRIGFGIMMFLGIVRFWSYGWIEKLYIEPQFHFTYYGFEWVRPLGDYTYLLFAICGLSALMVAIGYKYRIAIILFFLSFTYIELMDKTTYLNHYYFVSVLSFLMIFLPANRFYAVDCYAFAKAYKYIPRWTIDSIKLLICIVYFYAGLAKINTDWLLRAMPLKMWLPSKYDLPVFGSLMQEAWIPYAMSWSGMLYDLSIPFLLIFRKTRWLGFLLVVVFHVLTRILFPIGIFPWVMIVSCLIFFEPALHKKIIRILKKLLSPIASWYGRKRKIHLVNVYRTRRARPLYVFLALFLSVQILLPWRYLLYPGELFWTEEGFRFSWRVMLMEKMGYAQYRIVNGQTGESFLVDNSDFLTSFQEKQMSFQPDFILQYAHFLGDHFKAQGHENIEVYVDSYVALNGRLSQPYINKNVDLYKIKESFQHKDWILPFNDEIKGL